MSTTFMPQSHRKRGKNWTFHETKVLITIWSDHIDQLQKVKRNFLIVMKMHEALVVAGVERTAKDMKFRLKLLGTRFRREQAKLRKGSKPSEWEFFALLNPFLARKPVRESTANVTEEAEFESEMDSINIWTDDEEEVQEMDGSPGSSSLPDSGAPEQHQTTAIETVLEELQAQSRTSQMLTTSLIENLGLVSQLMHSLNQTLLLTLSTLKSIPMTPVATPYVYGPNIHQSHLHFNQPPYRFPIMYHSNVNNVGHSYVADASGANQPL